VDYLSDPITTTISSPQGIAPRSSSAPADNTEPTDEVATSNSLEIIESTMIQSTAIYTISVNYCRLSKAVNAMQRICLMACTSSNTA
jgi:hypothetical protein